MNINTPEQEERSQRAYQYAMEIIRQEWLEAGKTEEELDQQDQIADLYDMLVASGKSDEEIDAAWEGKSNAEILQTYATPVSM